MNRYDFLAHLHEILKPKVYLEIGVQRGWSLDLALNAETAIGVDPEPLTAPKGNQVIFKMTSDEYFSKPVEQDNDPVDLAFIDGMHLYEYALRDFNHVEHRCLPSGVILFDDVLPYNQAVAERVQPPGDWTGDVWKVWYILRMHRPDLKMFLVNTAPTGVLLVTDLDPTGVWEYPNTWTNDTVPEEILDRRHAVDPGVALELMVRRNF